MRHITKRFPGIVANDDVDFDLREGEVHALLGENGAGKSTLMNILYGLYHPDEGEIVIKGKPVQLGSPSAAIDAGVGMVHQHFMLIPVMTVAENIVLAERADPRRRVPRHQRGRTTACARSRSGSGSRSTRSARIEDITVGQQQRVEILKALYRDADILVLDEPTAVLTPQEADELFEIIRGLTDQGKSIIFISHKLNEVLEIADRITVLRRGKKIETIPAAGATEQSLARLMVGREVLLRVDKSPANPADVAARASRACTSFDDRGIEKVRGALVRGAGGRDRRHRRDRRQRPDGADRRDDRSAQGRVGHGVASAGADVTGDSALGHFNAGLGHIPEDRQRRGLVLEFSIAENIALHDYRHAPDSQVRLAVPAAASSSARAG